MKFQTAWASYMSNILQSMFFRSKGNEKNTVIIKEVFLSGKKKCSSKHLNYTTSKPINYVSITFKLFYRLSKSWYLVLEKVRF